MLMSSKKIPAHVAIIPDGNRRWSREKGLKEIAGHAVSGSYDHMKALFSAAKKLGVKFFSIWGFSTENWKRSDSERKVLFDVILKGLNDFSENAEKEKICFRAIGRRDRLPEKLVNKIVALEERTVRFKDFCAILCIDYGGRDEIVRAVNEIAKRGKEISTDEFANFLDTKGIPDVDLIIRTGGEKRLSGFMPFQSDYAEIYFSDIYFPDFGAEQLEAAILDFGERERRFGK